MIPANISCSICCIQCRSGRSETGG